jgi:hypothetical protein
MDEQVDKIVKELARDVPELKDSADKVCISFSNAPAAALKLIAETVPFTLDLKWKLLLNHTNRLYVTSDHPSVLYNQFLEKRKTFGSNTGLAAKGLQFFLPLGPEHLLMMYDGGVYRIGGRKHLELTVEVQESDVAALNALQAANADELLFFSPQTASDHIIDAVERGRKHQLNEKTSVTRYQAATEGAGELLHSSKADLRVDLILPSVTIIPSAAGSPIGNRVVQLRDPEFVRICKEFRASVDAGRYKSSQFGDYMRDRLRFR